MVSSKMFLYVISWTLLLVRDIEGSTYQNYSDVYTSLKAIYKSSLRPVRDQSTTINVSIDFVLLSIEGLSEQDQTLKTNGWLTMQWVDEILTWDADTTGVKAFTLQQKEIWKPDVTLKNTAKQRSKLGYDEQPVSISPDGNVVWAAGDIFVTSCDLAVTYYPFDYQKCDVIIYLWESTNAEILISPAKEEVSLHLFSKNGLWDLVGSSTSASVVGGMTEVTFSLTLQRRRTFYVVNIIIPVLFLSCLAPLVFALPAGSGEKMGFSVTVLLAYTVFLTLLGDSMPRTSIQTAILSVYLTAMVIISAVSVILSSLVLRIHNKPEDTSPGWKLRNTVRALRRLLCFKSSSSSIGVTPIEGKREGGEHVATKNEEITWIKLAETLDFFFLIVFSALTVIITIPSLVTMALQEVPK